MEKIFGWFLIVFSSVMLLFLSFSIIAITLGVLFMNYNIPISTKNILFNILGLSIGYFLLISFLRKGLKKIKKEKISEKQTE